MGSLSSPKADVIIDLGNPLLNHSVDRWLLERSELSMLLLQKQLWKRRTKWSNEAFFSPLFYCPIDDNFICITCIVVMKFLDVEIVDHCTYYILGDFCQMEGIANEACSQVDYLL
uniref:Transketolase N-terminal domain-containing protein n=1 Tax=Lactuca sativa TaxID=4236 RepID=A0A9R1UU80_LACSA|nr:hypothetical protein LSAT_V11C800437760 [Lactuca sativa]